MNLPVIEAERILHKMSRNDLASHLGVSKRTLQNWQNGTTEIPLSKVVLLTKLWGKSADYLLGLRADYPTEAERRPTDEQET